MQICRFPKGLSATQALQPAGRQATSPAHSARPDEPTTPAHRQMALAVAFGAGPVYPESMSTPSAEPDRLVILDLPLRGASTALRHLALVVFVTATSLQAAVDIDVDAFGKGLGGWSARKGRAAEYEIAEARYRTYRPEISPSPDGGIFVSVRIDHRRGVFSSDDHASLELSFAADGTLVTAQSSLALQGRTISSELIRGGGSATASVAAPYVDRAVKVGTELVTDLSAKLLREKIVEPGRVSFPAAIRHNYNLLYQSVRMVTKAEPVTDAKPPSALDAEAPKAPPAPAPELPAVPASGGQGALNQVMDPRNGRMVPLPQVSPYQPNGPPPTPAEQARIESLRATSEALRLGRDVVKEGIKSAR